MSQQQIPIAEPLIEVRRGAITESRHRGHIVAVEPNGNVVASLGSPQNVTFLRSSAKPFQALPLLTSGAAERFGFTDEEVALELIEIKIGNTPISFDQSFDADDNWLKHLTLRVKNIGTKPIVAFGIGGGLLHGIDEEIPMYASYQYGIGWSWGKGFDPDKETSKGPQFKPGETVELTYANVSALYRKTLAKEGEGAFCKLKFGGPTFQYADGSAPFAPPMRFRKSF